MEAQQTSFGNHTMGHHVLHNTGGIMNQAWHSRHPLVPLLAPGSWMLTVLPRSGPRRCGMSVAPKMACPVL